MNFEHYKKAIILASLLRVREEDYGVKITKEQQDDFMRFLSEFYEDIETDEGQNALTEDIKIKVDKIISDLSNELGWNNN